jgi:hypothetical protein
LTRVSLIQRNPDGQKHFHAADLQIRHGEILSHAERFVEFRAGHLASDIIQIIFSGLNLLPPAFERNGIVVETICNLSAFSGH